MRTNTIRPGPLALALLILACVFAVELVLANMAGAGPYPRHDHYGISEDKRQYQHTRTDDYEDYYYRRFPRKDDYVHFYRPSLSELDKTPEGEISLDRVTTTRSHYTDNLASEEDKEYGAGHYDQRDNKGIDVLEGGTGYY